MTKQQHTLIAATPAAFFGLVSGLSITVCLPLLVLQLYSFMRMLELYNQENQEN